MNIGAFSYAIATLFFLLLFILLLTAWREKGAGSRVVIATLLSTLWAAGSWYAATRGLSPFFLQVFELARDAGWILFLLYLLKPQASGQQSPLGWQQILFGIMVAMTLGLILASPVLQERQLGGAWMSDVVTIGWIGFSLLGLILVEQLYRNTTAQQRWAMKYLCLGLGTIFAYDFYLFSDALLFKQLNLPVWEARGIVNALAVPLIAISIARNPDWALRIHVSRQVVFHSITLIGAGLYLLAMAGAGYLIREYGGSWGTLLQITFLVGALSLLGVLLFSDRMRAQLRVFLSKHFFSYKYDYREEWMRFTQTLAEGSWSVPERVVQAMATLVSSPGGILWTRGDNRGLSLTTHWNMPPVEADESAWEGLVEFLRDRQWVIDLDEYRSSPSLYDPLDMPDWLLEIPQGWLIIPLPFRDEIVGVLLLKKSSVVTSINWEDRDLLKMAALQAASNLAQYLSDQALMQARQFEAFNRLSAYVVHDLKNILAQQSLIVSNAEKHLHNPAFVKDVIGTVRNSVARMTRLMEQMRSGMRGTTEKTIDLNQLVAEVVERHAARLPAPAFEACTQALFVQADPEQLATVFGHIIQNAQEATGKDGEVRVRVTHQPEVAVIEISDTGCGMDAEFVRDRLFKPFESTKGLTGMGVGAFESREIIRALGGEIRVESRPGKGSVFRITIPLAQISEDRDSTSENKERTSA